ncbi:uncharacterized protein N7459_008386 [Penicillium hispanicum]|uniref:uncharacterized protein n=1 Tax=Penicillium hispanicum TaxID=1080232 RepID=UPI0025417944|nr:uncharacterized protein N7459_008386 [Penicillium hispanicum]KAJ5573959.1 hypothetical protein N7459_008386 [Penicillium hispanicum]
MSQSFNPDTDIPDLHDKICLVTGGNSGLGEATIRALAQHNPKKVFLAARSRAKAEDALARIKNSSTAASTANIEFLDLDLASMASVKMAAARVNKEVDRLDILYLNGGVAALPPNTTTDGYEIQFGTNYLGHALLTQLLMPKMLATASMPGADVRIVGMSSVGHRSFANGGILFEQLKTSMPSQGGMALYGQAMLAKNLFAFELAKRYPQIKSSSLHPGTVKTAVWNGSKNMNWFVFRVVVKPLVALVGVSEDEGAKNQLWCSFSKDVKNGCYYEPIGKGGKESKSARDEALSKQLWDWTDKELRRHGSPGWVETK